MKTLLESILDDEDTSISNIQKEVSNPFFIAYSMLSKGQDEACVNMLNEMSVKIAPKGKWHVCSPHFAGSKMIQFSELFSRYTLLYVMLLKDRMYIYFPKVNANNKGFIDDLRISYKMTSGDFKKFKQQLIKELDLEQEKAFVGDCWISNKYK